jgi:hypothetical protein
VPGSGCTSFPLGGSAWQRMHLIPSFYADCPAWDHVVQLFVCCDDPYGALPPCAACQATVWEPPWGQASQARPALHGAAQRSPSPASNEARPGPRASAGPRGAGALEGPAAGASRGRLCGRELGRWVTPFRCEAGSACCRAGSVYYI